MNTAPGADSWATPVPRKRYFWYLVAQYLVWLGLYLGVNAVTAGRSVAQPFLPFERRIPLVPAAYLFYGAGYPEILLPLFLSRTRAAFLRTQTALAVVSLISFAVFLMLPMPYPRPLASGGGPFGTLLALDWSLDRPGCTFPSLHVATAVLLYMGMRDEAPRWRTGLLLLAIAVGVSTVLVKQHFIVDVLGGAAAAWLAWRLTPAVLVRLRGRVA
jgi:membrane-associated phospholipid phosphatase